MFVLTRVAAVRGDPRAGEASGMNLDDSTSRESRSNVRAMKITGRAGPLKRLDVRAMSLRPELAIEFLREGPAPTDTSQGVQFLPKT